MRPPPLRPDRAARHLPPFTVAAGGVVLLVLGIACARGLLEDTSPYPEVAVRIRDWHGRAEVTDTAARRAKGLSDRPALPTDRGLLFPYDPPARPRFWMLDMHFDIDIVWIRKGRIVDLSLECPHEVARPLPRYQSRTAIDLVLEVPAGTARRHGWAIGDDVRLDPWPWDAAR